MQKGSRINYAFYYKYDHPVDMAKLTKSLDPKMDKLELGYETIETRKENTGRAFANLTDFLALVGFIAVEPAGAVPGGVGGEVAFLDRLDADFAFAA